MGVFEAIALLLVPLQYRPTSTTALSACRTLLAWRWRLYEDQSLFCSLMWQSRI
jgi:hypothetical protein